MINYIKMFGMVSFLFFGFLLSQNPAGFSLSLDGDGDYADFGNVVETNFGNGDFTIEFWINKATDRHEAIIGKRELCGHRSFWNSRIALGINLEIDQDNTGINRYSLTSQDTITGSGWQHIAITRQDSIVKLYFNSVLDTMGIDKGVIFISTPASMLIGHNPCVGLDGTFNLTGEIDEVRIRNTVRSASQLQRTMNDTLGAKYYASADSGLIGYWRFDELEDLGINSDGADDVRDLSIYGNHGDLVGDAMLAPSGALVSITGLETNISDQFTLQQNYPNPFNPTSRIAFSLHRAGFVTLKVYDLLGREVQTLVNDFRNRGFYTVDFNAGELSGGVYLYRLQLGNLSVAKKMLLLK